MFETYFKGKETDLGDPNTPDVKTNKPWLSMTVPEMAKMSSFCKENKCEQSDPVL